MELRFWKRGEDARALSRAAEEVWTPCALDTRYYVSNLGRVWSVSSARLLTQKISPRDGYASVCLGDANATFYVHRLVLQSFDGAAPSGARAVRVEGTNRDDNYLHKLNWQRGIKVTDDVVQRTRDDFAAGKITRREAQTALGSQSAGYTSEILHGSARAGHGMPAQPRALDGELATRRMWAGEDARELSRQGTEVWAPVPRFEDRYEVSNLGRVLFRPSCRLLKLGVIEHAYETYNTVSLYNPNGRSANTQVHRVVLLAFDGAPPNAPPDPLGMPGLIDGAHLEKPGTDNRLHNLAWLNRVEHRAQEAAAGRVVRGERHFRAATTEALVIEGLQKFANREIWTIADLDRFLTGGTGVVAESILLGKTWTHIPRPPGVAAALAAVRIKRLTPDQRAQIPEMIRAGVSQAEIARQFGTTIQAVNYYAKKHRAAED